MWLPVAAASSFILPATLLLVYVVTAVLWAFSVAGVLWLMAIQIGLVAPLTVANFQLNQNQSRNCE
jgi:hypothetical protein